MVAVELGHAVVEGELEHAIVTDDAELAAGEEEALLDVIDGSLVDGEDKVAKAVERWGPHCLRRTGWPFGPAQPSEGSSPSRVPR